MDSLEIAPWQVNGLSSGTWVCVYMCVCVNLWGPACTCLLLDDSQWRNGGRKYYKATECLEAFIWGHLPEAWKWSLLASFFSVLLWLPVLDQWFQNVTPLIQRQFGISSYHKAFLDLS